MKTYGASQGRKTKSLRDLPVAFPGRGGRTGKKPSRRGRPPSATVLVRWSGETTSRQLPMHHFRKTLDDGFFDEGTQVVIFGRRARILGQQLHPQAILFEERGV